MKKITLIVALLISLLGMSQEIDILYDTTWKLYQFNYNGVNYNNSIPTAPNTKILDINEQNPDTFSSFIFTNTISGAISIDEGNETVDIFDTEITLLECEDYCDLEAAYIAFLYNDGVPKQFSYNLIVFEGDIEFIFAITDNEGNTAEYVDFVLSQQDFENKKVSLYPNPVSDKLYWVGNTFDRVQIYSIQGELLLKQEDSKGFVDVSALNNGIYFIELFENNKPVFAKFIKK